jgi:sulfatase maturation enzyme AslB (radical SAM superfamily)
MLKPDRARDDRRSVGSHEKIMGALGRAAENNVSGNTVSTWIKPESVRPADSKEAKVDKIYKKGLITTEERNQERGELAVKRGMDRFHK